MALIRHRPHALAPWFDVMDRWLERPFVALPRDMGSVVWSPDVDVHETDMEIVVEADLPDVEPNDVNIQVDNGYLTLNGERRSEKETKDENYYRMERGYGTFSRSFALPETVNMDKISAKYDKGVLRITLPKTEAKKKASRKITVH